MKLLNIKAKCILSEIRKNNTDTPVYLIKKLSIKEWYKYTLRKTINIIEQIIKNDLLFLIIYVPIGILWGRKMVNKG